LYPATAAAAPTTILKRTASRKWPPDTTSFSYECSFEKMAGLSPTGQNRLFLLGLGVSTGAVVWLMRSLLIKYRDAALEPKSENEPQYITQEVEDSLRLGTLDKLLCSPNFSIQETASVIICERALHDKATINALLWHITQPDHDMREKGIRTLTMMLNSRKFHHLTHEHH